MHIYGFWLSTKLEIPHNPTIVLFVRMNARWRASNGWQQDSYMRKRSHCELQQRSVAQFQIQLRIHKQLKGFAVAQGVSMTGLLKEGFSLLNKDGQTSE